MVKLINNKNRLMIYLLISEPIQAWNINRNRKKEKSTVYNKQQAKVTEIICMWVVNQEILSNIIYAH